MRYDIKKVFVAGMFVRKGIRPTEGGQLAIEHLEFDNLLSVRVDK